MVNEREYWVTKGFMGEGKGLNLSKSSLGNFVYALLTLDGAIHCTHSLGRDPRSYVQMSISLPEGNAEKLTLITGVLLKRKKEAKLN